MAISCMPGIPAAAVCPSIEDVDHPPLEVLSPKDGMLWTAAALGRVTWGDPFVVAMSDYDDKLAVG
jgi:hypothetical protein